MLTVQISWLKAQSESRYLPLTSRPLRSIPAEEPSFHDSGLMTIEAIRRWMKLRGYRLVGPKRELNLGPKLEIQFPFAEN